MEIAPSSREDRLLWVLTHHSKRYYAFVGFLAAVVVWGVYAWYYQLMDGLVVTGMRDVVIYGFYITNFVFYIGISHAGAFLSAILRLTKAAWGTAITRIAEAITVFSLLVGTASIVIDLGRPDRVLNLFAYAQITSPLIWDLIAVMIYLTGSSIFLYIALIPDIGLCRDRIHTSGWRMSIYRRFSAGWVGSEQQKGWVKKGIGMMAIIIIPIMVTVHTVVSYVFAMMLRVGWHSTVFGPYFVVGAVYSGVAAVITAMAALRWVYHLEEYIKLVHFRNLGFLLLVIDLTYIYFTFNEYWVAFYGNEVEEMELLNTLFVGTYAPIVWGVLIGGCFLPAFLIAIPKTRTTKGILIASILANIGMWIKRFVIIVPALGRPLIPDIQIGWGLYAPTWVEWSIVAGLFALFTLLYTLFSKVFPIVPIGEVQDVEKGERTEG